MECHPFVISIYSDDREVDTYSAWINGNSSDIDVLEELAEDAVIQSSIWEFLEDEYVSNWLTEQDFEDECDEDEWYGSIAPHATLVTKEDLQNKDYMKWFNSLYLIIDDRTGLAE